jgi:hypothetical protein
MRHNSYRLPRCFGQARDPLQYVCQGIRRDNTINDSIFYILKLELNFDESEEVLI